MQKSQYMFSFNKQSFFTKKKIKQTYKQTKKKNKHMNFDRENKKSHGAGHTQSMISSNGTSLIFFSFLIFGNLDDQ